MVAAVLRHLVDGTLGLARNIAHKVTVHAEVEVVSSALKRLPFSLREQASQGLTRIEREGIIERVDFLECVS